MVPVPERESASRDARAIVPTPGGGRPPRSGRGWGARGFTVLELAVVVVVLALLASVAIPLLKERNHDVVDVALDADLRRLQGAIDLYTHQHGGTPPGAVSHVDGTPVATAAGARDAFVAQLTRPSDARGRTAAARDGTFRYGPYLREGIPANPRNGARGVVCDLTTDDLATVSSTVASAVGWKVVVKLGRIYPADGSPRSRAASDPIRLDTP